MTDVELLEYIKNKPCFCCFCAELKKKVIENGVEEIDKHEGFICGGVEDMYIKRGKW